LNTAPRLTGTTPNDATDWHLALLYRDDQEYLDGVLPYLLDGLACDEPTFVAAPGGRNDLLRASLDGTADRVRFADMTQLGRNPGRIIPAIRRFVDSHAGRRVRFVGEPIWAGRTAAETVEATRHEALINLAFAGSPAMVLCPYDVRRLDPAVIDDAHRTHSHILQHDGTRPTGLYTDPAAFCAAGAWPLPPPPPDAEVIQFGVDDLVSVRGVVRRMATAAGLPEDRVDDLELAVNEVATNTLVHGAGTGQLRLWREPRSLISELTERGRIDDPLAGRHLPPSAARGGRGLFLTNHLCDLVELRSDENGTTFRLHIEC
jgi:anti-sigma regulatory factor (Ser/Thr protein kinase)